VKISRGESALGPRYRRGIAVGMEAEAAVPLVLRHCRRRACVSRGGRKK
jgi:hypothetical protein